MSNEEIFLPDDAESGEDPEFQVRDRRHWHQNDEGTDAQDSSVDEPRLPTLVNELRERTENAETRLQEYIEAYKKSQREQDEFRERLGRDVERRVALQFGELVGELLDAVDDLDRALDHVAAVPEAEALAHGVTLARDRFLSTLERKGVTRVVLDGQAFDPNEAEALRMDPVDDQDRDGTVTETLQPGYRLGDRVIRPARVAVGRFSGS